MLAINAKHVALISTNTAILRYIFLIYTAIYWPSVGIPVIVVT